MTSKNQPSNSEIYQAVNELRQELVQRDEMLEDKVDKTYLRIQVFEAEIFPIKRFVYGLITIAGAALVTAMMAVVLK